MGWIYSTELLRPVAEVEAQLLWPQGPDPDAVGIAFEEAVVPGPLGDYPAWVVPPGTTDLSNDLANDTWVIAVHGRGGDRRECLRILPTLHRLGHPVLAITYRNDKGAPASPDGHYHLGDTEWTDLAAAVAYARQRGAQRVVLYGWSMGAAIIAAYLDRGTPPVPVAATIWDSPLIDWRATLRQQAKLRRLPPVLTRVATLVTRWRIGIDFDLFDLVARMPKVRVPTLLVHGADDSAVPPTPSRKLAAAAPSVGWPLRYLEVPGAEHTAPWNVDPAGYEAAVAEFLRECRDRP
ncbi:alpha/beta hydrolase [Pseudonocardia spinosispora]|uniref:alpha/beta hydrolase n=1 Tax=Pseudonocardia spinosispora TaxID=103441 RepID=UPI00042266B2|nr:alpha/beta fold hydrolase [Pseudonocardia spinosispora]